MSTQSTGATRLATAAVALLAVAAVAWGRRLSHSVPRGDDLVYMDWARRLPADLGSALTTLPPFPGFRPLTALVWGVLGIDASGQAVAAVVVVLWLWALASWSAWAGARGGRVATAWMMALMLATPWFRDLPTWRSWLTTVGALAFGGTALWALERRWPVLALVCGLAAIGFKESAMPVLAVAAVAVYRRRAVGGAWLIAAGPSVAAFAMRSHAAEWTAHDLAGRAQAYTRLVGESMWLPSLAGAAWSPWLSVFGLAGTVAPGWVGGAALLSAVALSVRRRTPWALVVAASLVLPLAYGTVNPVYMVDGALVCAGLFAAALGRARLPAWVGLVALAPVAWTAQASWDNQRWQAQQWELARTVIAERDDQPPGRLHLAADAHDGGRFIAWWLVSQRGWTEVADVQPIELCHGLSASPEAARP